VWADVVERANKNRLRNSGPEAGRKAGGGRLCRAWRVLGAARMRAGIEVILDLIEPRQASIGRVAPP